MTNFDLHWRYFLGLEEDLIKLSRFVELSEKNFSTFSVEFVRLILTTCSEIDAVMKLLCKELSDEGNQKSIGKYREVVLNDNKIGICQESVFIGGQNLKFVPWESWEKEGSPLWWQEYNKIKHNRSLHFEKATLGNFLDALTGLFISLYYWFRIARLNSDPLFDPWADQLKPHPQILILEPSRYSIESQIYSSFR